MMVEYLIDSDTTKMCLGVNKIVISTMYSGVRGLEGSGWKGEVKGGSLMFVYNIHAGHGQVIDNLLPQHALGYACAYASFT